MSIKKIHVEKFTVFENIEIEFCSGINVIIGENGTGKTHLLKLLYAGSFAHSGNSSILDGLFNKKTFESLKIINKITNDNEAKTGALEQIGIHSAHMNFINPTHPDFGKPVSKLSDYSAIVTSDIPYESVFIPVREVLSLSNLPRVHKDYRKSLNLDKTMLDIIEHAKTLVLDNPPELLKQMADRLSTIIEGTAFYKDDEGTFWIQKHDGLQVPFDMEAEGFRKLGLLWLLLMNKSITENTVLLWDEPEANLNPEAIPVLVNILLELARKGVQIFLSTHNYFFAKYLEALSTEGDSIAYHGLYKKNPVMCESQNHFEALNNNSIIKQSINLYEAEIRKVMG